MSAHDKCPRWSDVSEASLTPDAGEHRFDGIKYKAILM
jgi:hypothetical protein